MELNNQEPAEQRQPISVTSAEQASLDIIRTETVLSRLPVHNLAKQGRVNIQIIKTTPTGEVELKWEVSYSDRYGQARQLAYKLDTIIINQRIEEAGRPLPKLLRIGSLNDICAELNLATHAGQNSKDLKKAFLQNASAFINAKFNYRANDGTERHVEAGITRYGVIFTGEKLPDGRKADAVYVAFNDPFWEVLNNAPVRPLDRAYMKSLPPAAQRFYEIISRKIFAALKNNYPRAKIAYSEYCTFSAQLRHFARQPVQDQMAKVIRHHKASGYIAAVKYESAIDSQNQPDWILYLTPGPKAFAEFAVANGKRKIPRATRSAALEAGDRQAKRRFVTPTRQHVELAPTTPTHDPQLIAEFTRRGITEKKAIELAANLKPGQEVVAQLEHADQMVKQSQIPISNPAGFIVRLIEWNTPVPDGFETSAKKKIREEKERAEQERRAAEEARQQLESEYEDYCDTEVDRYIEANTAEFEELKAAKWKEDREKFSFATETMAKMEARYEIRKRLHILTFDGYMLNKKQGTDFSLKPVAVPPAAEAVANEAKAESTPLAHAPVDSAEPAPREPIGEPTSPAVSALASDAPTEPTVVESDAIGDHPKSQTREVAESAIRPPEPQPEEATPLMLEFASDQPQIKPDDNAAETSLA